ncbi:MAG TPA: universal stress protein [Candidatus Acidoferrales bacterium]|nr:universal stress protein [Candidatus Acidoferrales bacterium]
MAFPFRKILCPVDFEENSMLALEAAADLARANDGTLLVMHVVPMVIPPTGMPVYVDLYRGQEDTARGQLEAIARKHLAGIKHELLTSVGEPAGVILHCAAKSGADLIVMATHGRRGFSRFFLGSIAELVVRESPCPVLTVRSAPTEKDAVGTWMTRNPVTASPDEKLTTIQAKMLEGGFRCVPVLKDDAPVGIVTDRDVRKFTNLLDQTQAYKAMSEPLITVSPTTDIREAARLIRERKIGGLPVVENGKLVGVLTAADVLEALTGPN